MLKAVKESIDSLPDESFGVFYQSYIADLEDEIIERDMKQANSTFHSIEDITDIIKCINALTEELK